MQPDEKIKKALRDLPAAYQAEVLDYLGHLVVHGPLPSDASIDKGKAK